MLRNIASTLAWVGRTASMLFGLALVGAVVVGLGSLAFGANGAALILGSLNNTATAVTRLTSTVPGAALQIINPSTAVGSHALQLSVPCSVERLTRKQQV